MKNEELEDRVKFLNGVVESRSAIITGQNAALKKAADEIGVLNAEVTRMDKRTRHLLDRIEDAEAVLLCRDPAYQDEYWKRYPESERGKFTASSSQDIGDKMADEYLEAETEHMADRITVDSNQESKST